MASEALYKVCSNCGATASSKLSVCAHCGHKLPKPKKTWLWFFAIVAAFLIAGVLIPGEQATKQNAEQVELKQLSNPAKPDVPAEQKNLVAILQTFQKSSESASNDLQLAQLRDLRKSRIRSLDIQMNVQNWVGTIKDLTTNSDGMGVLVVELAPKIYVGTWNNAFSDVVDNTLIPKTSAFYERIAAMKVGDEIVFSGMLFTSEEDGIREKSLTMRGSLAEPEILLKFSDK